MPHMDKMVRLNAKFTEPQSDWLRLEAKRLGIGVAELLRRIVDEKRGA